MFFSRKYFVPGMRANHIRGLSRSMIAGVVVAVATQAGIVAYGVDDDWGAVALHYDVDLAHMARCHLEVKVPNPNVDWQWVLRQGKTLFTDA